METYITYMFITRLLDHYETLYHSATTLEGRVIARQGLEHYKRLYQAYNN
jgi:hypothetical protein